MDAKSGLEAFAAIRNTVDEGAEREAFDAQIVAQYSHAVETAGPVAVAAEATAEADPFQTDIREFLSDKELDVNEQFNTMITFWQKLGVTPPFLDASQADRLKTRAEATPERRIMAVPLLDHDARKAVAERARAAFPDSQFGDYEALWTPDENSTYGKLLRDPEATIKDGHKSYGLRYHTEDGILTRSELIAKLTESGQAATAEDGTVWLFPIMDVRVRSPRQYVRADALHRQADITQVPESLITMQLLHQVNGTPNPDWEVDFTNEAVYELDKKGNPVAPVRVAGVDWYPDRRQLYLVDWIADDQYGSFGGRGAESGL